MYRDSSGQEIYPFDIKKNPSLKKTKDLIKLKQQMKKLVEIMNTKYKGYDCYGHRGIAQGKYQGLSKGLDDALLQIEGVNPNLKDLALPFSEFCKLNGVEEVMKIWIGPYTSFGYGFFDEIPAAYVMKYLDTTTAIEFVSMRLWTWKDGTQSIYEAANKKLLNATFVNIFSVFSVLHFFTYFINSVCDIFFTLSANLAMSSLKLPSFFTST
jgi:hypothetical protein